MTIDFFDKLFISPKTCKYLFEQQLDYLVVGLKLVIKMQKSNFPTEISFSKVALAVAPLHFLLYSGSAATFKRSDTPYGLKLG